MIILAAVLSISNLFVYGIVVIIWMQDCKEIGKDNLAVPLPDRLKAAFLCFTLPCIIGLVLAR